MSEVKRYHVTEAGLVEGEALGRLSVVLAADHDRVTAERDALLKKQSVQPEIRITDCKFNGENADGSRVMVLEGGGEIVKVKALRMIGWHCFGAKKWAELQQRLTAAEQRNAELVDLLTYFRDEREYPEDYLQRLEAAIKPTESGASE